MQRVNLFGMSASKVFFSFVLTFTLALFILVVAFFNQALFILHGYDVRLIADTSVEAFVAYGKVYNSKLSFLLSLAALSLVSFFWLIRLRQRLNSKLYSLLFLVFGIVAIISVAFVVFYFFLPARLL